MPYSLSNKQPKSVAFGVKQLNGLTYEDRYFVSLSHNLLEVASFGIFDGHGGKFASNFCTQTLHDAVIRSYCDAINNNPHLAFKNCLENCDVVDRLFCEAIRVSFKSVDKIIRSSSDSGTTAVSIFLRKLSDGSTRVLCPWVGDSRCVMYERCINTGRKLSICMSEDHKPSLKREANRIKNGDGAMWTGIPHERSVEIEIPREHDETHHSRPPSIITELMAEILNIEQDASPESGSLKDKFASQDTLDDSELGFMNLDFVPFEDGMSEYDVDIDNDDENAVTVDEYTGTVRRRSYIASRQYIGRFGERKKGELAVFNGSGISLCMTRSIGDRDCARSCVCIPDVTAITIPAGQYARFVLASDGLWDVLSVRKVQDMVFRHRDPQRVAEMLAKRARVLRTEKLIRMDDITVIVVDVNPDCYWSELSASCSPMCSVS